MKYKINSSRARGLLLRGAYCLLILSLILAIFLSSYGIIIPKTVSCFVGGSVPVYSGARFEISESSSAAFSEGELVSYGAGQYKVLGIPVKSVTVARLSDVKVYAGGVPFGIKFFRKGACVVGFENESENPAFLAGLRLYDTIIKVNGRELSSTEDLQRAIESGKEISLTYLRAGKEGTVRFKPKYSESEQKYTLGIWLKDSGAGIGTLTFVLEDGSFGGLGHGICDSESGELTQINNGSVCGVTVSGILKGQRGAPGELKGYFNSSKVGSIYKNSECGVFGALASVPEAVKGKSYSLGLKNELEEGGATVICTLDDNVRREYSIEISNINRNCEGNKCFTVKITDERLIGATGGIVQGMSGSPIIQNGKIVGAVTHVLVNDPTMGYGIFVENMIAQMSSANKRAA